MKEAKSVTKLYLLVLIVITAIALFISNRYLAYTDLCDDMEIAFPKIGDKEYNPDVSLMKTEAGKSFAIKLGNLFESNDSRGAKLYYDGFVDAYEESFSIITKASYAIVLVCLPIIIIMIVMGVSLVVMERKGKMK